MNVIDSDVIVCGGGTAGLPAAVAAAREGASVCVVEEDAQIGGAAVDQYIQSFCGHPVQGIYRELVEKMDALAPENKLPNAFRASSYVMAYLDMMRDLPVKICTRQKLIKAVTENGKIVTVESDDCRYKGRVFIDATGDGHVAAMAGCPFRFGREAAEEFDEEFAPEKADGLVQRCTLMYTVRRRPDAGHSKHGNEIAYFNEDESLIWGPTVFCENPSEEGVLAAAQMEALSKMPGEYARWAEKGFYITSVAPKIGVRESRRIEGLYMLSYHDIKDEHTFEDSVCVVNYNIDPWDPTGNPVHSAKDKKRTFMPYYEIPYRCLVNGTMQNLLVAGRCVSATHVANSSLRVMGIAIPLGQAAGTAAAMAVKTSCPAADIDVDRLRRKLRDAGVCVSLKEFENKGINPYE